MHLATRNAMLRLIGQANRILLIGHVAPDGDCIGSLLGMAHALNVLGKQADLACADPLPAQFDFLAGFGLISRDAEDECELIISLDCSDIQRMGSAYHPAAFARVPLINIDHHLTNVHFGTVEWVDTTAAATAEMVYELVEEMAVPVSVDMATCLLTGIATDTRGFRTPTTTVRTMSIATRLMQAGASLSQICDLALDRRPLAVIRLWTDVLAGLQLRGRVIWSAITRDMRARHGLTMDDDAGGLASFMLSAPEADIAVVFDERPSGKIDVGFRSIAGVDVARVAVQLGGGGHPQASGCTIAGAMPEVQSKVLSAVAASLATQRAHSGEEATLDEQ
jgi:phosphoesterase RecJ-like protein